ncbi:hypothetical protein IU468_26700 [Nocardia farcinica]|uniref:hypothetical protein n=1 Tax=Nocardia farcinica TaxID=37329 RepID=UPI0018958FC3|nr:hypothetical protein [Nocardia farcinica]MBF6259872.1 hypothetical protein [Nocardia farcinica]
MVRSVARDMAVSLAHEAPTAIRSNYPPPMRSPTRLVGRTIAGLVIVVQLVIDNPPAAADELSADVHQPTDLIF